MTTARRATKSVATGLVLLALLCVLPGLAQACAVCTGAENNATAIAFRIGAAFLTIMPFVLVGFVLRWLWRHAKEREEADRATQASRPL